MTIFDFFYTYLREPFELNYLQIGGNARLQKYFELYDLKRELAIATKYKTKAAFYYRDEVKITRKHFR